jgi:general secretion pathway protein J
MGFTLLEMLVALVVLGFVILGLTQGIRFGIAGWTAQSREIQRAAPLISIDRFLRELVQRMDISASDEIRGTRDQFTFVGRLPDATPGQQDLAIMTLAVTRDHRLVLRWRPHPHVGTVLRTRLREATLLNGVASIDFGYRDISGLRTETWESDIAGVIPRLVQVKIALLNRHARQWPTIIIAPVVAPRRP